MMKRAPLVVTPATQLKFFIRETLSALLNKHRPGSKPNIAMIASRRSGTTLIAQTLGRAPGVKSVDQPLSPFSTSPHHRSLLPAYAGGFAFDPSPEDMEKLSHLFQGLHRGDYHFGEPWQPWEPDFHWRSDRLFLKMTAGHGIVEELPKLLPVKSFAFFRHPVPHALSCLRLNWPTRNGNFLRQRALTEQFFNARQIAFIETQDQTGSAFVKLLCCWFVENAALLRSVRKPKGIPAYTYEALVGNPEQTLSNMCDYCEIDFSGTIKGALNEPSRSARRRSGSSVEALLTKGDHREIVEGWTRKISTEQAEEAARVFDILSDGLYQASDPYPNPKGFETVSDTASA